MLWKQDGIYEMFAENQTMNLDWTKSFRESGRRVVEGDIWLPWRRTKILLHVDS